MNIYCFGMFTNIRIESWSCIFLGLMWAEISFMQSKWKVSQPPLPFLVNNQPLKLTPFLPNIFQ